MTAFLVRCLYLTEYDSIAFSSGELTLQVVGAQFFKQLYGTDMEGYRFLQLQHTWLAWGSQQGQRAWWIKPY